MGSSRIFSDAMASPGDVPGHFNHFACWLNIEPMM